MPTTLERTETLPAESETETVNDRSSVHSKEELFRITSITNKANSNYKIKYQTAFGIEWLPEQERDLGEYLVSSKYHELLFPVIGRVFDAEWGNKDLRISSIKFHYAEADDKGSPKKGIQPKPEGSLIRITISSEYQSQSIISRKSEPWLSLGAFDQYICKDTDDLGYLQKEEILAVQNLVDAFSKELARKLNERIEFKPKQLKLI